MFFVGIDWADEKHTIVILDEVSRDIASFEIPHSYDGIKEFTEKLKELSIPINNAYCFIETSRGLLVSALLQHGFKVYPLNPKVVDRQRKPSGAKTDFIDARLLADIGRKEYINLRPLMASNDLIEELRLLTRDQEGLVHAQTRLTNQLIACLKEFFPTALKFFTRIPQLCTLKFLQRYPSAESLVNTSKQELINVLIELRHKSPDTKAQEILEIVHQPQIRVPQTTIKAKSRLALVLIKQLLVLVEELDNYDKTIMQLFKTHNDAPIFAGLPGAGKRLAPKLLAEWGDNRTLYDSSSSVQALAGTSPVAFQSGKYNKARRRTSCVKPFRNALHEFAWCSVRWEPWAKEYYYRKRKEGKSHHVAIRSLANNWVRIIYALWKKQEQYDSSVFRTSQLKHFQKTA
jgi:transposase